LQNFFLSAVHATPGGGRKIVEPLQVKETVDEAEQGFFVGGMPVPGGVARNLTGSEENLPVRESNYIRGRGICKKFGMDPRDGGIGNDGTLDLRQATEQGRTFIGKRQAVRLREF
jgi:hypothetical protein